ncbi:MAG: flagellar hook-associated protein FlgL [Psychromonas sp.]|nr:flagellar hook-associated protein FlgL [Psychromonas sp.]
MRISSQVFFQRNTTSIMAQQSKLSQQNLHLSTQKRVISGADDPVAMAAIQRLKQQLSINTQNINNGHKAQSANAIEDTALGQVTNILQRVRELTVSSGNGTLNAEAREANAMELEGLREELIGVANTRDGSSQYIFAGYEVDTKPFQKNEFGSIEYHGNDGSNSFQIGTGVSVKVNDSGSSIFTDIPNGNGIYLAEGGNSNTGSGAIDAGSVIDRDLAASFAEENFTIAINKSGTSQAQYSVYGINDSAITGSASLKISQIDLNDPNINNVLPGSTYPNTDSNVDIQFIANGAGFDISINGQAALPTFDPSQGLQTVTVDGISVEIKGMPVVTDIYKLTHYQAPIDYTEGQSIEFNGLKTMLKGDVHDGDTFSLTKSENEDIFSTIQGAIDALRIKGSQSVFSAQREMRLNMSLSQIDNAMANISQIRTSVGARMRTIENQREATLDFSLTNQKTLSKLEDLDMASAISDFQLQLSLLEVTQQTFIKMQSLDLFRLI